MNESKAGEVFRENLEESLLQQETFHALVEMTKKLSGGREPPGLLRLKLLKRVPSKGNDRDLWEEEEGDCSIEDVIRAIRSVPPYPSTLSSVSEALESIDLLEEQILKHRNFVACEVQKILEALRGYEFSTLEEKKQFASRIQALLNVANHRVKCPKEGCGRASLIRVLDAAGSSPGVFQCEHVEGERNSHRLTPEVPRFIVVPAPADRREKIRSKKT